MIQCRPILQCLIGAMIVLLSVAACNYRLGTLHRALPGGYDKVSIPVFTNKTGETAFEVIYTNALIQQFSRSKVAQVVDDNSAQVTVLGSINNILITSASEITSTDRPSGGLPTDSVLTTSYRMVVTVAVELQRNSDRKVLWSGQFDNETTYNAAQITMSGLNSANPVYNQSAKEQNIERLAKDVMAEAHDRMTENF